MCKIAFLSSFLTRLVKGLSLLSVFSLLAALLPQSTALAKTECDATYEVKRRDTLSKIATKYGVAVDQIAYANDWDKPYTIYVGQRICIPTDKKSGVPKVERKYADALAVYFGAARAEEDSNLLIYTYNYPKTTVIVKVDNATDSLRKFEQVGKINIAAVGNQKTWRFKLSDELKNARHIFICLKDTTTGYLQCVYPRSGP